MKKLSAFMVVVLFLSACTSNTPQADSTIDNDKVATIVVGTLSAMTMQALKEVTVIPTTTPFPGTPVSYDKVSLVIPPTIASGISGSTILLTAEDSAPWGSEPEHIQVNLDNYILQGARLQPRIYLYPAEEYAALQDMIANNIAKLNSIFENPNQQLTDETLPFHLVNAARLFASNRKAIHFQNGQGIRYITQHAQYPAPINNYDLFYYFSGLTNSKKFYITVILPISTNQLPESAQLGDSQPAGGLYLPPGINNTNENDWREVYLNITTLLDNTQADAFSPSTNLLDDLIGSINIVDK